MKASGTLVASMVAASTMALTSSSSSSPSAAPGLACAKGGRNSHTASASSDKEKFEPRFDGLRFIETLVTAHR